MNEEQPIPIHTVIPSLSSGVQDEEVPGPQTTDDSETMDDAPRMVACDICQQSIAVLDDEEVLTVTEDADGVCQSCLDEDYVWVPDVEGYVQLDNAAWDSIADDWIMAYDAITCEDCGSVVHEDHSHGVNDHTSQICQTCLESGDYCFPEDGSGYYHVDRLYWSERHDAYFLEPQIEDSIHCYSTDIFDVAEYSYIQDKRAQYGSIPEDALLMGVELEMDTRDSYSDDIAEALRGAGCTEDTAIFKHDGTVSGLELVTLPADLASHKAENSAIDWRAWCNAARPVAKGHHANSAGMHVHLNRTAISALTLGKMLVFVNSVENAGFISTIAQRDVTACQWCKMNPQKFDTVAKSARDPIAGKYSVINVTNNTVELRIFRSNLQHHRIYKNLEFCDALVRFCNDTSARNLTVRYFRDYVAARSQHYPDLHDFIVERWVNLDTAHTLRDVA